MLEVLWDFDFNRVYWPVDGFILPVEKCEQSSSRPVAHGPTMDHLNKIIQFAFSYCCFLARNAIIVHGHVDL